MNNLAEIKKAVADLLNKYHAGYVGEVHSDEIITEVIDIRYYNENKVLVCAYDREEKRYVVAFISGSLEDGYEFEWDAYWDDSKEAVVKYFNEYSE